MTDVYAKPHGIYVIDSFANRQELAAWQIAHAKEALIWALMESTKVQANPVVGIFRVEGWFRDGIKTSLVIGYQVFRVGQKYFLAINHGAFLPFKLTLEQVVNLLARALGVLVETHCQIKNPWPSADEVLADAEPTAALPIIVGS